MENFDTLFNEIGYKRVKSDVYFLRYYKDDCNVLAFDNKLKSFTKSGEYDGMCDNITMQELKVINKVVKLLGFL